MKRILHTLIFTFILAGSSMLMAQTQTNLDKGLRYVEQNAQKWGLVESDYADIMVSDMYTNYKTGVTYIYLIQAYKGIPINNAITPVIITPEGKVSVVRHGFVDTDGCDQVYGRSSRTQVQEYARSIKIG